MPIYDHITQNELHDLLIYDPETGLLYWKNRGPNYRAKGWNTRHAGKEAFARVDRHGYKTGWILDHQVRSHRIIWRMVYGHWPIGIDHEDGDKTNNRLSNLSEKGPVENARNARRRIDNKSGVTGVHFRKLSKRWVAYVGRKFLGTYTSFDDAVVAREANLIGYSPRHGR